jgi:tetratricopeptide (TPR) repeat protein
MDHGQCLTEETLTDYLEGGLDPVIKAASEVHLLACDRCRNNLGFFMRLMDEDVSAQEVVVLQTVTNQWDKKKPARHVQRRAGTLRGWIFSFAPIAAMLVVSVVSFHFLNRAAEPKSASEVVQLLLEQHRPFEFRLSNQPHLPIVRTRGLDDPGVSYGLLAGEMSRLSANGLQMGRFYLIQKDFKRAIDYLEIAEGEVGAGAEVHNDLGVAYLESGDEKRFQKAAREFQDALKSNKAFAPAAFNLAMLYERTGETAQAELQWNRYLKLDSNSAWAVEARSRLQGLSR